MNPVRKKKLTIYLEADLAHALDIEARLRGLATTRAAADALRRAFANGNDPTLADAVKTRLDGLEKGEVACEREIAIIKETLFLALPGESMSAPGSMIAQALHGQKSNTGVESARNGDAN